MNTEKTKIINDNLLKIMESCSRFEDKMHSHVMELIDRLGDKDVSAKASTDIMNIVWKMNAARFDITGDVGYAVSQISDQL